MKQSFVQELGDHLFSECIENSYYNDEHDVDCLTPDFDSAYQLITSKKNLSIDDLKEVYRTDEQDGDGKPLSFTGVDLLKLAVCGDFSSDFNSHSSELGNLKMCLNLIDSTKGDKKIWEQKKYPTPPKRDGYYGSDLEYKKNLCENTSLANLVGSRVESAASRIGPEGLKIAKEVGKKLKGYRDFGKNEDSRKISVSHNSHNSHNSDESVANNLKKVAAYIVNDNFKKLSEIRDYDLRNASTRFLLYGKSGDAQFDKIVNSTTPLKELLATKSKEMDI